MKILPHGKVSEAHQKEIGLAPGKYTNKPGVGIMGQSHEQIRQAPAKAATTNADVKGNRADIDSKKKNVTNKDKASLHHSAARAHAEAAAEHEAMGNTEQAKKHKERAEYHRGQHKDYKSIA